MVFWHQSRMELENPCQILSQHFGITTRCMSDISKALVIPIVYGLPPSDNVFRSNALRVSQVHKPCNRQRKPHPCPICPKPTQDTYTCIKTKLAALTSCNRKVWKEHEKGPPVGFQYIYIFWTQCMFISTRSIFIHSCCNTVSFFTSQLCPLAISR